MALPDAEFESAPDEVTPCDTWTGKGVPSYLLAARPHPTSSTTRPHLTMSSDYEFSDDEDYNEYDDDEEAMDVEGGPSYPSLFPLPNNLILAYFLPK